MKLEILGHVSLEEAASLNDLFEFISHELDLRQFDATVKLKVYSLGSEFGLFQLVFGNAAGATSERQPDGNIKMWILDLPGEKGKFSMLEIFAHEMVHVADIFSGRLVPQTGTKFDAVFDGVMYRDADKIKHRDRPWERRANEESERLMKLFKERSPAQAA